MDKFFDRFKPKSDKKAGGAGNILGGMFGNNDSRSKSSFRGQGQSLGGSKPGQVIPILLPDQGPLGIMVEKRPNAAAIVNSVVEGSQAAKAGIQRGDILCFAGTGGMEEIQYSEFLQLAKSSQRPLSLEVRRVQTKTAHRGDSSRTADAFARKQAMIAAVEAREKAHKNRQKPMKKIDTRQSKTSASVEVNEPSVEPQSEESKQAVAAAKNQEIANANQLGYNPYETNKMSAGQARNTTVAMTHGTIQASSDQQNPSQQTAPVASSRSTKEPVSPSFAQAYETAVTNNEQATVASSFKILQKLIVNATTKGQSGTDDASKFRRVRLANEKINTAVVQVEGALDILMSVDFQLVDEQGESFLVYPPFHCSPTWLPSALEILERYANS